MFFSGISFDKTDILVIYSNGNLDIEHVMILDKEEVKLPKLN